MFVWCVRLSRLSQKHEHAGLCVRSVSFLLDSIGENIKLLVDRPDGSYCFRLHNDRVYYMRWWGGSFTGMVSFLIIYSNIAHFTVSPVFLSFLLTAVRRFWSWPPTSPGTSSCQWELVLESSQRPASSGCTSLLWIIWHPMQRWLHHHSFSFLSHCH